MENYDEAKRLRELIIRLKNIRGEVNKLEVQKKQAAQDERYDDAKNFKLQIEILVAKAIA